MDNNLLIKKYKKYKIKYLRLKSQNYSENIMEGGNNKIVLEKETQEFINNLIAEKNPPIYTLTYDHARSVLDNLQINHEYTFSREKDVEKNLLEEINFKIYGLQPVEITLFKPKTSTNKNFPGLFYIHGGGWILGNYKTHHRLCKDIAIGAQCIIIFINYTPSPEAKFPVAIEQAYNAINHIYNNYEKYSIDRNKLAIMGDSVGGNMATVVCILLNERLNNSFIKYQILAYPVTDSSMNTESYKIYKDGPWLTKLAMKWFWDAYEPDVEKRKNYLLSPLQTPIEKLSKLPPALIITDENDVLRDEGENYAKKLIEAGVDTISVRYIGTIHDFLMLNSLKNTQATKNALDLITNKLKKINM